MQFQRRDIKVCQLETEFTLKAKKTKKKKKKKKKELKVPNFNYHLRFFPWREGKFDINSQVSNV